jgi:calcineurin-like phosphoesterase family protein
MMHEKWFTGCPHFFHANIIRFSNRPFKDVEEMNASLIKNNNDIVGDNDFVYWLGDMFIGGSERERAEVVHSLKGRKRLIVGNHDHTLFKQHNVINAFEKIMYWHGFPKENFTATHVPHELFRIRDGEFNVHAHTHLNLEKDPHYISVSSDVRNWTPVHMDTILAEIAQVKS